MLLDIRAAGRRNRIEGRYSEGKQDCVEPHLTCAVNVICPVRCVNMGAIESAQGNEIDGFAAVVVHRDIVEQLTQLYSHKSCLT